MSTAHPLPPTIALEERLRVAEESAADWQAIALRNGELLATAEVAAANARRDASSWAVRANQAEYHLSEERKRVADCIELIAEIDTVARAYGVTVEKVVAALDEARACDAVFEQCGVCGGAGEEHSRFAHEFGSLRTISDCPECDGTGRVWR